MERPRLSRGQPLHVPEFQVPGRMMLRAKPVHVEPLVALVGLVMGLCHVATDAARLRREDAALDGALDGVVSHVLLRVGRLPFTRQC